MESTHETTRVTSSTLAHGLKVLEITAFVGQNNKGVSLQEVTKEIGLHRSNVYRYLRTLVECGWLEVDPETFRYRIGRKLLQIAGATLGQLELRAIARPFLEELAAETHLTVHLAVLNETSIVYIDKVESDSPIQMRSRTGMMMPSHCTGIGKALLASINPQSVKELLAGKLHKRTPNTLVDMDDLLLNLELSDQRGYAVDMEENEVGIGCVAAPIFGYDNNAIAAISVSTLIQNLTAENIANYSQRVMRTARRISERMGCYHNHWSVEQGRTTQLTVAEFETVGEGGDSLKI